MNWRTWRTSTGNVFQVSGCFRDFRSMGIYEWEANIIPCALYVLLSIILLGKTPFRTVGCQRNIYSVRGVCNEELQPPGVWQDRSTRQSAASVHETDLQRRIREVLQTAQPMTAIDIARRCGLQRASDVNPSLYQLREQGVLHFDQMAKNVKPLWSLRT